MSTQYDPYKNFKFRVVIEGVTAGAFKNVEGLDSETEVVEHRSGAPRSMKWRTAVGVRDRAALDRASRLGRPGAILLKGFKPLSPQQRFLQTRQGPRSGSIVLTDPSGRIVAQWNVSHGWPCKWKGFTLDGKGVNTLPPDKILLVFQKVQPSSPVDSSKASGFKGEISSIRPRF